MKKKFLLALMVLCLLFTATSCQSGTADKTAQGGETTESLHVEESRVLELESGTEGAIAPN